MCGLLKSALFSSPAQLDGWDMSGFWRGHPKQKQAAQGFRLTYANNVCMFMAFVVNIKIRSVLSNWTPFRRRFFINLFMESVLVGPCADGTEQINEYIHFLIEWFHPYLRDTCAWIGISCLKVSFLCTLKRIRFVTNWWKIVDLVRILNPFNPFQKE